MDNFRSISASVAILLALLFTPALGLAGDDADTAPDILDEELTYNRFSFGFSGGLMTPFTDVKENEILPHSDEMAWGGEFRLNYHMSPLFTLQANFLYGQLTGVDQEENLRFDSDIMEFGLNARISVNKLFAPHRSSNEWFNFYAMLGAGIVGYETELMEYSSGNILNTQDLSHHLVIPFGLGMNFRVSDRIDIGLESSMRYINSDRLDLTEVVGSSRDLYNYTGIGITIRLGRNTRSMDWAPPSQVLYPGDPSRLERLAERARSNEQKISALEQKHDEDIASLREEVASVTDGQAELGQRTTEVFGAFEDLSRQVIMIENRLDELEREPDTFYSVQVMALKEDLSIEEAQKYLGINTQMEKLHINGWYKYISGRYHNLEDAILQMQRIWGQGVRDAFVVKYEDGVLRPR